MKTLVAFLFLTLAAPVAAQDCTPTVGFALDSTLPNTGNGSIPDRVAQPTRSLVPAGQVWEIQSYGVGYQGGYYLFSDGSLLTGSVVQVHRFSDTLMWGWSINRFSGNTPSMMGQVFGHRELVLVEGEGLGLRLDRWWDNPASFVTLLVRYWAYPAACLGMLKGAPVATVSGTAPPPIDFSAAVTALQQLSTAAASAANALP